MQKYIRFYNTNAVESTNGLEGYFNLKIKHCATKEGYDLTAFYSSAMWNVGSEVDGLIVKELGLPWELHQQQLSAKRANELASNEARKASEGFLTRKSELVVKRKRDSHAGANDACYKSVEDAQKHLIAKRNEPRKRKKKEKAVNAFDPGALVYVKFATIWHHGVVLEAEPDNNYKVNFLDKQVQSLPYNELFSASPKPNARIWVPPQISRSSVAFSDYDSILHAKTLSVYYENYAVI